jgi:zinc transport system permease protein
MGLLDDFLVRAMLGGLGVALVAGPLGCFVVWRRLSYFGATLAHGAMLGIALGFLADIDLVIGVAVTGTAIAVAIVLLERHVGLAADTLLGLLAHSTLALGLVIVSFMETLRLDLMGYLFGDILSVGTDDLAWIWGGGAVVLGVLAWIWRDLLALTVDEELARAEGVRTLAVRLVFTVLLALVIAVSMRLVGILLITSMLIIPAATVRALAAGPERMAVLAAGAGALAVAGGLGASLRFDTPSGPSIVVCALALFILVQAGVRSARALSHRIAAARDGA